ncbi:hypothetical protein PD5205_03285 [Xanthomonas fragariae]|uniref:Uncharacterized protein n=1 Tax=Xanthomonas fragariae TaxID=48664 RepID=A0A1Y6H977_9XANT|nr:hypothetical protein NBC2815_00746 [Xanthomonas fragariae]SMQ97973.1 hypothetical protein PD885_00710 [Xanthomonas fragariae]SMR04563.1 hypothetical protein PD5205_03285 [Xanthomonas fragariae]
MRIRSRRSKYGPVATMMPASVQVQLLGKVCHSSQSQPITQTKAGVFQRRDHHGSNAPPRNKVTRSGR